MMNYQEKYFKPYYMLARTLPDHDNNYERLANSRQYQRTQYQHYNPPIKRQLDEKEEDNGKFQRNICQPIWQNLYRQGQLMLKRKNYNISREQYKIDPQCTFQPLISKNRRYIIASNSSFFQRNKVWLDNRIQKVVRQKEQQVNKNLKDCTFEPAINKSKKIKLKNEQRNMMTNYMQKRQKSQRNISKTSRKMSTKNTGQGIENKKNQLNVKKNVMEVGKIKQIIREELKRIQFQ